MVRVPAPRRVRLPRMAPPYEELHAWRECHELALAVYRATKDFPTEEQYGLTSQTRRAAFSAAVNIVEGSARRSRKEFRRFLRSEEHTSELQSPCNIVCRLLLEKK